MNEQNPIIYLAILFILFLIGREFVCWYFKINKTIAVLEEIRDSLKYPQQITTVENKIEPNIGDTK